jgi:phosphate transport system substrate-binding protein
VRVMGPVTTGVLLLFCCFAAAAGPVQAETVTLAGSGGMIPLLTALATAYMKGHPHDRIEVNPGSLTQSGGILAVKNGAVDIGMSARNLTDKEKDESVETFLVAKVAAEVAVHRNVTIRNLTVRQFCDIYEGKISNWQEIGGHNAQIVVLTRPDSDSTKQAFREGIACFRTLQEGAGAIPMAKSPDMQNALMRIPDSIGIIDSMVLSQTKGKARPVMIDGQRSSPEAVAAGRWPVVKRYNLIVRKNRSRGVDSFMRFVRSPEGRAVIKRHKGVPVDFNYR